MSVRPNQRPSMMPSQAIPNNFALIDAFIAGAALRPEAPLVVASDTRPAPATLAEILAEGRTVGEHLRAMGVAAGEVVAVQLPAWREWMVACVAAAQAGAVLLPIVSIYGPRELAFVLRQSRA